jgi:DCN1-like protein 1/2
MSRPKTIDVSNSEVKWEWYDSYDWKQFDRKTAEQIEKAYQNNKYGEVTVNVNNTQYKITFSNMYQTNLKTSYTRNIQRTVDKKQVRKVNVEELYKLFDKYKQIGDGDRSNAKEVNGDGIMQFASDIGVDPEDVQLFILFYKLNCSQQYEIKENEWITGFATLGMETFQKMKQRIPKLKDEIKDEQEFTDFYLFCFNYMKQSKEQRSLNVESAVSVWKLIMQDRYRFLNEWCDFIENKYKKAITQDTWKSFLEFTRDQSFQNFKTFDLDSAAYPTAIDEFVESMRNSGK